MTRRRSRLLGAAQGKFGYLLLALIAFLATAPVIGDTYGVQLLLAAFGSGLLVAGLFATRPGRRSLILGLVVAVVEFGIGRMVDLLGTRWLICAQTLVWLLAMSYVAFEILEWVLESAEVTLETLQAAFCVFLLLGLIWAFFFMLVEIAQPDSFRVANEPGVVWSDPSSRRLEFIRLFIFSYSTLSGTGYADLEPVGNFAAMAACLEAMTAKVYLAVVVARLVSMHAALSPRGAGSSDAPDPKRSDLIADRIP